MTVEGHIENGQIVLNQEISLPEGMKVGVELIAVERPKDAIEESPSEEMPSLYERMKPFVGA